MGWRNLIDIYVDLPSDFELILSCSLELVKMAFKLSVHLINGVFETLPTMKASCTSHIETSNRATGRDAFWEYSTFCMCHQL